MKISYFHVFHRAKVKRYTRFTCLENADIFGIDERERIYSAQLPKGGEYTPLYSCTPASRPM